MKSLSKLTFILLTLSVFLGGLAIGNIFGTTIGKLPPWICFIFIIVWLPTIVALYGDLDPSHRKMNLSG